MNCPWINKDYLSIYLRNLVLSLSISSMFPVHSPWVLPRVFPSVTPCVLYKIPLILMYLPKLPSRSAPTRLSLFCVNRAIHLGSPCVPRVEFLERFLAFLVSMLLSYTNEFLIVSQWFPAIYAGSAFPVCDTVRFLCAGTFPCTIPLTFPFVFRCVLSCPTLCIPTYVTRAFFNGFLVGSLRR